jgi:hypothetical protein
MAKHGDGYFGPRLQWVVPTTNDCGTIFSLPVFLFVQSLDIPQYRIIVGSVTKVLNHLALDGRARLGNMQERDFLRAGAI